MSNLKIEYLPVGDLKPYKRNARKHETKDISAIKASIEEFGFDDPIGIWKDNIIIEGHGRLLAAKELGMTEVPCIRLDHLTDEQRRAYALAHNRTAELSEWDFDVQAAELKEIADIDMGEFGFDAVGEWFKEREKWDTDREDGNTEYNEFLDKFERKKTTDDCYTPDNIYDVICSFVETTYGGKRESFLRPFYPGGDYEKEQYPQGCVVVDNPPFSILAEIIRFYCEKGIRFFLFAPALTLFSGRGCDVCYLPIGVSIIYENGANISTSFITNMEEGFRFRTYPELYKTLQAENDKNRAELTKELPNYEYPPEVVTAASLSQYSKHGVSFSVKGDDCQHISALDAMKETGKGIFGGGFLLSVSATKENKRATDQKEKNIEAERAIIKETLRTVWQLSDREKQIVTELGKGNSRV